MTKLTESVQALGSGVRFGKFASVGAAGAAVDTATILLLTSKLTVHPGFAKLIGAELAIIVMFIINERWTFAEESDGGGVLRRFAKSNLVRAGGVGVATVVFVAVAGIEFSLPVGGREAWLVIANGAGISVGLAVNYVAESLITWQVQAPTTE